MTFVLVRVIPGGPAYASLGEGANDDPIVLARLQKEFGLDKPLVRQYFDWISGAVRGDFGESFRPGRPPVGPKSGESFPGKRCARPVRIDCSYLSWHPNRCSFGCLEYSWDRLSAKDLGHWPSPRFRDSSFKCLHLPTRHSGGYLR